MRRRVASGWLHRLHRGVYAVGHARLTRHGRWMAAVLAGQASRPDGSAILSHRAAASLWEILKPGDEGESIEVIVRSGRPRRRLGLIVRRLDNVAADELARHRGIPCTAPARTLFDLASVLTRRRLERAIDEAERRRLCKASEVREVLARQAGRRGAALLAAVLDDHDIGSTVTRSELEERFLVLCRERGLPQPLVNQKVLGLTVDFLWPSARLVVEVDGRASHDTRRAFQDDRDRDSLLATHGYVTLRFTWWDVDRRPAVVAQRVAQLLGRRVGERATRFSGGMRGKSS